MEYVKIVFDFIGSYGVIIIIGLIAIIGLILQIRKIMNGNLVEWLINKVADAEAYFGSDTGKLKLRAVYDVFVKDRPLLSFFISFEKFSKLVDIALDKFETMLNEDEGIAEWFESLKESKSKEKQKNDSVVIDGEVFIDENNPDQDVDVNVFIEEVIEEDIVNSIEVDGEVIIENITDNIPE